MDEAHKKLVELIRRGLAVKKATKINNLDVEHILEHALVQAEYTLSSGFGLRAILTRNEGVWTRAWYKDSDSASQVAESKRSRMDEVRRDSAIGALEKMVPKAKAGKDADGKSKTA